MITIEFLLSFSATIVMVYILSSALLALHSEIQQTIKDHQQIMKVKETARTVEIWMYNGQMAELSFPGIYFKVERSLMVDHPDGVIEIEGVFLNDNKHPV